MHIQLNEHGKLPWVSAYLLEKLDTEIDYQISIVNTNVCTLSHSLQVIFNLKNKEKKIDVNILIDYPVNSEKFYQLIQLIYFECGVEILEIDTEDFHQFAADGKIRYVNGKVDLDYSTVYTISAPVNHISHEWLKID